MYRICAPSVVALLLAFGIASQLDANAREFRYNNKTGQCVNKKSETGLNAFDPSLFSRKRDTPMSPNVYVDVDAECTDFSGFNFDEHFGTNIILLRWNLSGSRFERALFHFSHIQEADMRGADLEQFDFGYATLSGTIDRHTKLPLIDTARCSVEKRKAVCTR